MRAQDWQSVVKAAKQEEGAYLMAAVVGADDVREVGDKYGYGLRSEKHTKRLVESKDRVKALTC